MNIFEIKKIPESEEILEILAQSDNIRIERILSNGQTTDWMIQDEKEFVVLLQGNATIEFDDREIHLSKGDTLMINEKEKHKVSYTSESPICIWFCVFFS